ncbi:MAG: Uma2 family endonuclease [bacterium]|nr:Uma2 family endonuclease [bacterium]
MAVQVHHKTFCVDEYHRMAEAGIFSHNEHVELISGEIIAMVPIGSYHASQVDKFTRFFVKNIAEKAIVRVQNPIYIDEHSEPEPDVVLVKPRTDFYAAHHPEPKDVLLIVEVSDSSLDYDRDVKLPIYAHAGIQESWIVNLQEACVEVHSEPSKHGYAAMRKYYHGKKITPAMFPNVSIAVDDIFGTSVHP